MYAFDYHRPASLADALTLLRATPEAKLLAGGQTLIPTLKQRLNRPDAVIDLGRIAELRGIRLEGDRLVLGALVRHGDVAGSDLVRQTIPSLAHLAETIGDTQVRNLGTLGGSVANNDPAADYPAALVALRAIVQTDRRSLAAEDFFTGMFETALEPDEIITAVSFEKPDRGAYIKFRNPASRYAIVGVYVAKFGAAVRAAVTGAGPSVFRLTDLETKLAAEFSPAAVAGLVVDGSGFNHDIHASRDYRAHLVAVMARRAVMAAV